jgi:hypothetical protein
VCRENCDLTANRGGSRSFRSSLDHAQVLDNSARAFRPPFVHRSTPEYQPGRVLIDVFDRLVQLGKGTAAIDGEGLEFLEA